MKKTKTPERYVARVCWKDTNQPVLRIHNCIKQLDLDGTITYYQQDGGIYKVYLSEVCYISYRPQESEEKN